MIKTLKRLYQANHEIIENAGSLVGTAAVTSGLGFAFWWLAARLFPPAEVGLASAAISAMLLLGTIGMLGLGTLLMGELSHRKEQAATLITTALVAAAVAGGVLSLLFALIAPFVAADLHPLSSNPLNLALFIVGGAITALTLVLDQALIGLLLGNLQLRRNSVFALIKLLVMAVFGFLLADKAGMNIYLSWTLGNIVSLVVLGFLVFRKYSWKKQSFRVDLNLLGKLGPAALAHHALNLVLQAPPQILPIIVTMLLSATSNAHFYFAWLLLGFVYLGPLALATMFYTSSAANPKIMAAKLRFTMSLAACTGIAANIVLLFGGDILLNLFGPGYAAEAGKCLRVLGLGVFPLIVKDHYVAICRVQGRTAQTALRVGAGGCLELIFATVGTILGGLSGLSVGWVVALLIEAILMAQTITVTLKTSPDDAMVSAYFEVRSHGV